MTLDELINSLPATLKPWATQYGPSFLAMTGDELKSWFERIMAGDIFGAYKQVVEKLPVPAFLDEWVKLNAAWQNQNEKQVAIVELQKEAAIAVLKIFLAIALAVLGI